MQIRFVYGILPALVFYTDWISRGGIAIGPVVLIQNKWRLSGRVLIHELEHVRQSYRLLMLGHFLLYLLVGRYRLWAEVAAYAKQAQTAPVEDRGHYLNAYAKFITERYRLNVSMKDAYDMLKAKGE